MCGAVLFSPILWLVLFFLIFPVGWCCLLLLGSGGFSFSHRWVVPFVKLNQIVRSEASGVRWSGVVVPLSSFWLSLLFSFVCPICWSTLLAGSKNPVSSTKNVQFQTSCWPFVSSFSLFMYSLIFSKVSMCLYPSAIFSFSHIFSLFFHFCFIFVHCFIFFIFIGFSISSFLLIFPISHVVLCFSSFFRFFFIFQNMVEFSCVVVVTTNNTETLVVRLIIKTRHNLGRSSYRFNLEFCKSQQQSCFFHRLRRRAQWSAGEFRRAQDWRSAFCAMIRMAMFQGADCQFHCT